MMGTNTNLPTGVAGRAVMGIRQLKTRPFNRAG
jgi:hypothetical protein